MSGTLEAKHFKAFTFKDYTDGDVIPNRVYHKSGPTKARWIQVAINPDSMIHLVVMWDAILPGATQHKPIIYDLDDAETLFLIEQPAPSNPVYTFDRGKVRKMVSDDWPHAGIDIGPGSPSHINYPWESRIACYGKDSDDATALRDHVLAALEFYARCGHASLDKFQKMTAKIEPLPQDWWAVAQGTLNDGFTLHGPFTSGIEAEDYADALCERQETCAAVTMSIIPPKK